MSLAAQLDGTSNTHLLTEFSCQRHGRQSGRGTRHPIVTMVWVSMGTGALARLLSQSLKGHFATGLGIADPLDPAARKDFIPLLHLLPAAAEAAGQCRAVRGGSMAPGAKALSMHGLLLRPCLTLNDCGKKTFCLSPTLLQVWETLHIGHKGIMQWSKSSCSWLKKNSFACNPKNAKDKPPLSITSECLTLIS